MRGQDGVVCEGQWLLPSTAARVASPRLVPISLTAKPAPRGQDSTRLVTLILQQGTPWLPHRRRGLTLLSPWHVLRS